MKGIVLEVKGKEVAVLYDNGTVLKIKNRNYEKGQVINMNNKFKFMAKAGSIAAALIITTVTGFAYTNPTTYVSVDVNPSIEYELNTFDRVLSVVAVNEDGEKIVNELDVKNEKIEKAILKTIEKLKAEGYLTEDEYAGIVIAVSNKNAEKSEKVTKEIEEELDIEEENEDEVDLEEDVNDTSEVNDTEEAEKSDEEDEEATEEKESDTEIIVEVVGRERVEEARKLNVTPGKLNLVQKLIESTDDFDDINEEQLKELLSLSVKEINKMKIAYKKGLDVIYEYEIEGLENDEIVADENEIIENDNKEIEDDKDNDAENDKDKDNTKDKIKEKIKEEKENKEKDKKIDDVEDDDFDDENDKDDNERDEENGLGKGKVNNKNKKD